MTEKASADDFQVQNYVKKKKKKRKHKEGAAKTDGNEESAQTAEHGPASPLLPEAAPREEGCTKKKKKNHKKQPQPLSEDSYVELEEEFSSETGGNTSPGEKKKKKKKKKKWKHQDGGSEQGDVTCVPVNQHKPDFSQEVQADYVYVKEPPKKKRKEKLPAEAEVCEPPASERQDETNSEVGNKKKKKKKRKGSRSSQETEDCSDGSAAQPLLSSPEQTRQGQDTGSPSAKEGGEAATPQCEDGDWDSSAMSEDFTSTPIKHSRPAKAAAKSPKTPARARKVIKSSAFVTVESSSESDDMTPEATALKEKKNSSFTDTAISDELGVEDEDYLDCTMYLPRDLDAAKQQLEEFIPHVRNISDNSVKKMAGRDLARFKEFKKQGIAVKFGRFSKKENEQIRKNVEDFLSATGIDSAEKLLFTSRYPEDKGTIHRLKAKHLFCEKLSEGIPRPWRLIYYRARKMFDPNNYKGRYTDEEKQKLKKYHALHGNDWKKISEMMSRSNLSVAMKYSEIKSAVNYGPWSKEETRKLMNAVEEVIRKRIGTEDEDSHSLSEKSSEDLLVDREKLYEKLPWTEIEAKVGTRYWRQCKQKWNTVLTNKMTKGQQLFRGTKGLQAKINLIKRLYEMDVEDPNDLNWEEFNNIIGDVPKAYVQGKFYKLKVSVPFWQKKTFSEIIEYLYEKKIPELEEKLEKMKRKQLCSDSSAAMEQRNVFRLSDIFYSSEDSD